MRRAISIRDEAADGDRDKVVKFRAGRVPPSRTEPSHWSHTQVSVGGRPLQNVVKKVFVVSDHYIGNLECLV